jgi:hypothetical protein
MGCRSSGCGRSYSTQHIVPFKHLKDATHGNISRNCHILDCPERSPKIQALNANQQFIAQVANPGILQNGILQNATRGSVVGATYDCRLVDLCILNLVPGIVVSTVELNKTFPPYNSFVTIAYWLFLRQGVSNL